MPPDGYESITLRTGVVEALNEYRTEEESFSAAIERLLEGVERPVDGSNIPEGLEQRLERLEDEVQQVPERAADSVEARLR